jgi:ubiquinol-cytochrome c reductase iron-sulfur subunit
MTVEWRGKPVWIVNRTPSMLAELAGLDSILADANSDVEDQQPVYAQNPTRSIRPEILVLEGICTHLGCAPLENFQVGPESGLDADWKGGFYCPCHGSKFDLAGRVYRGVPAPTNMKVPPHSFLSDTRILIGVDPEDQGAA